MKQNCKKISRVCNVSKIVLLTIFTFLISCSDVNFSRQYSYQTSEFFVGKVDILFVVDNSGSMSAEHKNMADRFGDYIDALDASNLDYQIAMITTDVSASIGNSVSKEANGDGKFQDGKFLEFKKGKTFLTKDDSDREALFADLIQRDETLDCEIAGFGRGDCPSFDERGIYAATLAVERGSSFFREGSHLAVVFLSDEDERSTSDEDSQRSPYLPREQRDKPENFVKTVKSRLGEKPLSVYSIVVQPDDLECRNKQDSQGEHVFGEYGVLYAELAEPSQELKNSGNILAGELGDICADDYGSQLSSMGDKVSESANKIKLGCNPLERKAGSVTRPGDAEIKPLEVKFNGVVTDAGYDIDKDNVLSFITPPTPGTKVTLNYTCSL